jgi:hypothetical protein
MVLTLAALRSFDIIARHKGFVVTLASICRIGRGGPHMRSVAMPIFLRELTECLLSGRLSTHFDPFFRSTRTHKNLWFLRVAWRRSVELAADVRVLGDFFETAAKSRFQNGQHSWPLTII